ncbi:hypothetical protein E4T44_05050 [Aureobasidium sp. EXF-8845]|nr:hypothetical protein E4T45_08346 [Aureobasidium sp. EXF-8846]KAI4846458.1 hypothetical protein E4T44_05050 [Aureobasidium sp. EXF-8845]
MVSTWMLCQAGISLHPLPQLSIAYNGSGSTLKTVVHKMAPMSPEASSEQQSE